jgi:hypothetical protein
VFYGDETRSPSSKEGMEATEKQHSAYKESENRNVTLEIENGDVDSE